jgi:hypothetical protein
LCCDWTRHRYSGRHRRSPTGTSTTGTSTTRSGHSGHRMQGSPPQRSLCDGLLLVLCI